jgi:trans-aconitate methyltransferase
MTETWGGGDAYERYMGRWSRTVAAGFLRWLARPSGLVWADVGCGPGTLTSCVLDHYAPASVTGLDSSDGFVADARRRIHDARARFEIGRATSLPWEAGTFDVTVSGLVLNFVADHDLMACEMARVTRPGGIVGAYVWDYAGGMQMLQHFWDVAVAVSPHDSRLHQADRFPVCRPDPLRAVFERAGLPSVEVRAIEISTVFDDFEAYWQPFLGRQGAAPTYLASVDGEVRERIRATLQARLAPVSDRPIELTARAWAVQGRKPSP